MAVLAATLVVGALVQGIVGLGVGLVTAPILMLLAPELMPVTLLATSLLMPVVTLAHERHDIDWRGLGWSLPARVPGTAAGVWLVATVGTRGLGIVVGLMVLATVAATYRAIVVPVNRRTLVTAGVVSGVTGTATSIGGPPLALLYQHRPAPEIRCTLAVYFLVGALLSIIGLGIAGSLDVRHLLLGVLLMPALVLGGRLSRVVLRVADPDSIRLGVLTVCAASAVGLLVRSMLG